MRWENVAPIHRYWKFLNSRLKCAANGGRPCVCQPFAGWRPLIRQARRCDTVRVPTPASSSSRPSAVDGRQGAPRIQGDTDAGA